MSAANGSGGRHQGGLPMTGILSFAFVGLLVLAGIAVLIFGHGSKTAAPPPPHHSHVVVKPGGGSTPVVVKAVGGCSLPAGNQAIPSKRPPTGTVWQTVGSVPVPQAPTTLGPQHQVHGANVCFAHSPSGALLAAMNFWAEYSTNITGATLLRELMTGVPAALTKSAAAKRAISATNNNAALNIAGYKFTSDYTAASVEISVVLSTPSGGLEATVTPMRWLSGTWKVTYTGHSPPMQALPGETVGRSYVSWSDF